MTLGHYERGPKRAASTCSLMLMGNITVEMKETGYVPVEDFTYVLTEDMRDSALLKLLTPNENTDKNELKVIMDIAVEYRKRVNDWLHILAPGEFPKKKLNYTQK